MALAHITAGRFEEAASFANRTLLYNSRFGGSVRLLVASHALLGHQDKAAEALERLRNIDPEFSLARLRARLGFMHDRLWNPYAEGLKLDSESDNRRKSRPLLAQSGPTETSAIWPLSGASGHQPAIT
jgi:hypothetical protein